KPSDFTAAINWGDGSPAFGGVVLGTAQAGFTVTATHTYDQVGSYPASVTITNNNAPPGPPASQAVASFTATVKPTTHLAFVQQPTRPFAGQPLPPAVTAAVLDSNDNTVSTDNSDTVTLSLGTNPAGGTLGGTLSAPVVHGVATFSNVSLSRPGNGYTLLAA